MMKRWLLGVALLLASCGSPTTSNKLSTFDVEEPTAAPKNDGGPQIAYSYDLAYRLDPGTLDAVHRAHLALCRSQKAMIASAASSPSGAKPVMVMSGP